MTKDLSRQLCELAGIEAKHLFSDVSDNHENGFTAFNNIFEADLTNGCWMQITKEPVYPNFETPENFVKLLRAVIKYQGGYDFYSEEFETELTEFCIQNLQLKDNKLKQALQAQDFKY